MVNLNKRIAVFLAALLLLTVWSPGTAGAAPIQTPELQLICGSAPRGGTAKVELWLKNSANIGAVELKLQYGDGLSCVSSEAGQNVMAPSVNPQARTVKVVGAVNTPYPSDCLLATFTFRVEETAAVTQQIRFLSAELTDIQERNVPCKHPDGAIPVKGLDLILREGQALENGDRAVEVRLAGEVSVSGLSFTVCFPETVQLAQTVPGLLKTCTVNDTVPGQVSVSWADAAAPLRESGVLLTLHLRGSRGQWPLHISQAEAADEQGVLQQLNTVDATVSGGEPVPASAEFRIAAGPADRWGNATVSVLVSGACGLDLILEYPAEVCRLIAVETPCGGQITSPLTPDRPTAPGRVRLALAGTASLGVDREVLRLTVQIDQRDGTDVPISLSESSRWADEQGELHGLSQPAEASILTTDFLRVNGKTCANSVALTVTDLDAGSCLAAAYDSHGRMLAAGMVSMGSSAGSSLSLVIPFRRALGSEAVELRLFALDGQQRPQLGAESFALRNGVII